MKGNRERERERVPESRHSNNNISEFHLGLFGFGNIMVLNTL